MAVYPANILMLSQIPSNKQEWKIRVHNKTKWTTRKARLAHQKARKLSNNVLVFLTFVIGI